MQKGWSNACRNGGNITSPNVLPLRERRVLHRAADFNVSEVEWSFLPGVKVAIVQGTGTSDD